MDEADCNAAAAAAVAAAAWLLKLFVLADNEAGEAIRGRLSRASDREYERRLSTFLIYRDDDIDVILVISFLLPQLHSDSSFGRRFNYSS